MQLLIAKVTDPSYDREFDTLMPFLSIMPDSIKAKETRLDLAEKLSIRLKSPAKSPNLIIGLVAKFDSPSQLKDILHYMEKMDEKPAVPTPEAVSAPAHSGPPAETTQAMPPDATRVSIDQFFEIDLRVAEILAAERIEKSKKLIRMRVSTGDAERTLVAGIATKYTPEELVGRKVVIVANLQPATLMGVESNGMVLAASIDGQPSLIAVDPSVPAGTKVK